MRRPSILRTYIEQAACYISKKYDVSEEKAIELATRICKEKYKPLTGIIVDTKVEGCPVIKAVDLAKFLEANSEMLVSPSGSFYIPHKKKLAKCIQMIIDRLAQRKKHKKLMLKYKAEGNEAESLIHYYSQTLIKININSLPGNFGSAYSIFFNKENYNAITSGSRALIGYANSMIEALLGGNFAWFSVEELLQHIYSHITHGIPTEMVRKCMEKYKLQPKTWVDLFNFYKGTMEKYDKYHDWNRVRSTVESLSFEEIQYFYYFQNLRHLLMENDAFFRNWLKELFDIKNVDLSLQVEADDLFKVDGALAIFCNVAFHEHVDPQDSSIQLYDLPKARPDLAKKFVCIAKYMEEKLKETDDLFATFIYTPLNRTSVKTRPFMYRNSAVISDTDSSIFTVKDWVGWFTGDIYSVSSDAYAIATCMIYWITNAVTHALKIFSIAHGAEGQFESVMAMKNEFLYPVMVLADVKKHYAGVTYIQEGVILPTPEIDIKGVQFKGSDICKLATEFAKHFIEVDILENLYKHGRISAHDLIEKVRNFEARISSDIQAGKTDWFNPLAIRTKDHYANPMSSNWYSYFAWEQIFAESYGDISLPTKTPAVHINRPNKTYLGWLEKENPSIYKKMINFLDKYKRFPSAIAINPVSNRVPKELIPLIKASDIIHSNVKPCHLILKQIGISVGYKADHLLFMDVYPESNPLSI